MKTYPIIAAIAAQRVNSETAPESLRKIRKEALGKLQKDGIPTSQEEGYRHTRLDTFLKEDAYVLSPPSRGQITEAIEKFQSHTPNVLRHTLYAVNGHLSQESFQDLPNGITVGSLQHFIKHNPQVIEKHFHQLARGTEVTGVTNTALKQPCSQGKQGEASPQVFPTPAPNSDLPPMAALNSALCSEVVVIHISPSKEMIEPIQIISLLTSEGERCSLITPRFLIVAEKGSVANILFGEYSEDNRSQFVSSVLEFSLDRDSCIDFLQIQTLGECSASYQSIFSSQRQNAALTLHTLSLKGRFLRSDTFHRLEEERCELNLYGISYGNDSRQMDITSYIDHCAPHCKSNQLHKFLLDDESTGHFTGKIHVSPEVYGTEAYQQTNSILNTKEARVYNRPQLVIEADDVSCSHGATIGQIDQDALFFLQTRGIAGREARAMLMQAFVSEVINSIPVISIREQVSEIFTKRLSGDFGKCAFCTVSC